MECNKPREEEEEEQKIEFIAVVSATPRQRAAKLGEFCWGLSPLHGFCAEPNPSELRRGAASEREHPSLCAAGCGGGLHCCSVADTASPTATSDQLPRGACGRLSFHFAIRSVDLAAGSVTPSIPPRSLLSLTLILNHRRLIVACWQQLSSWRVLRCCGS